MKNPYQTHELKYFLHTFKRQPLLFTKAKGIHVWDEAGKKYIDFFSGLAVCGVGHNHRAIVRAVQSQAARLLHVSNYFYTSPQLRLAEALTKRYSGTRVFFSNSGAEANETAVKLARLWANKNNKKGREIITFENGFHGRTLAMTAASRSKKRGQNIFEPLPAGFKAVPFNDINAVKKAVTIKTIGIMVEPVQGEGGIHVATTAFLKSLAQLCRHKKMLLIVDEIQSGMGRTGTFFAFEQAGIKPHIVTLAKGLAGGLPLAATLAVSDVAQHVKPGLHGSTFGGNPVSCAASLEVLKLLTSQNLSSIRRLSGVLRKRLSAFELYASVKEIRQHGLMVGIELDRDGAPYVDCAREKGMLINCTQGNVLRFLPPYFMTIPEMDRCLTILHSIFKDLG